MAAGFWGFGLLQRASEAFPIERVARAAGRYRPLAARLTGGFRYAACGAPARSDRMIAGLVCTQTRVPLEELERVAAELRDCPGDDHARGLFDLLWPHLEGSVEEAVESLRRAAETFPLRAAVHNDLAAALLALAELVPDPKFLIEAHREAQRAIELDSSLAEAWFNRALALKWLHLPEDALEAWSGYLTVDSDSEWAAEARLSSQRLIRSLNAAAEAAARLQVAIRR